MAEITNADLVQDLYDAKAKLYYEADIRVAQGEDREKVAKDLGLDKLTTGGGLRIGGGLFIPVEAMINNQIEADGRTTLQNLMREGAEKQFLEKTLSNLEKANEKKRVIEEKKRNLLLVVGCVIGLFFFIGSNDK